MVKTKKKVRRKKSKVFNGQVTVYEWLDNLRNRFLNEIEEDPEGYFKNKNYKSLESDQLTIFLRFVESRTNTIIGFPNMYYLIEEVGTAVILKNIEPFLKSEEINFYEYLLGRAKKWNRSYLM